jgi:hypothetical protein
MSQRGRWFFYAMDHREDVEKYENRKALLFKRKAGPSC